LRDRLSDLPSLADHLLAQFAADKHLHADAYKALLHYTWPGNVRELRNLIIRAAILADGPEISAQQLALDAPQHTGTAVAAVDTRVRLALGLCAAQGNISEAARHLGVSRSTLYRQLTRLGWSNLTKEQLLARAESLTEG
jgi:transcriptional regulator of acetoin/glycerol metabolism